MIQLASDPNASRRGWRPLPAEARDSTLDARRGRTGHAWPFISRHTDKPAAQQPSKTPGVDSGS